MTVPVRRPSDASPPHTQPAMSVAQPAIPILSGSPITPSMTASQGLQGVQGLQGLQSSVETGMEVEEKASRYYREQT